MKICRSRDSIPERTSFDGTMAPMGSHEKCRRLRGENLIGESRLGDFGRDQ